MRKIRAVIILILVCTIIDVIPIRGAEPDYIAIPGVTKLVLEADKLDQKVADVDFYNPEENECTIVYELVLETGKVIWRGNPLQPGYRYKDIKLKEKLPEGRYKGIINAKCFDKNGGQLNSCSFEVNILSKKGN